LQEFIDLSLSISSSNYNSYNRLCGFFKIPSSFFKWQFSLWKA